MLTWFPWKWIVRRAARSSGVIDPFSVLARLRKFAEPAEVDAPLDLLRAWTVLQARGIVNSRAIQHNLDWIWPYWVERQFNPRDPSFVPRAFSLSHINVTHRNWTAVSAPDADRYALVDPRGLVTPLHDGWSLDAWLISNEYRLAPSRCEQAVQAMRCRRELAVETEVGGRGCRLIGRAEVRRDTRDQLVLQLDWTAQADPPATLCIALRPYNPEGVQFVDDVAVFDDQSGWEVNGDTGVRFDRPADRMVASTYEGGDVYHRLHEPELASSASCPVGMATAAALFPIGQDGHGKVSVTVPLPDEPAGPVRAAHRPRTTWATLDETCPRLDIPDEQIATLFHTALRTLLSLSAGEIVPGSYTYRRFWFRDACLMLNALLVMNQPEPCRRAFDGSFPRRQTMSGFFQSQQGEWDSNGQVLWLVGRYAELTRAPLPPAFAKNMRKGAEWLCRKRTPDRPDQPYPGLLPPGLSAEHLGPNNYYYWDNFWGLAGLRSAAALCRQDGDVRLAASLEAAADDFRRCIEATLDRIPPDRDGAIPAAPARRMDAGAVGSIVADYPLQLYPPGEPRILRTVEFLLGHCLIDYGFFHDMNHSGINPYLTLQLAQVLLRAGDPRFLPLVRRIAHLASPTGQWPEAIHPFTEGGCMGDGQHGWAAAEWVMMVRNLFLREEPDHLVVGAGVPPEWLQPGTRLRFGPTLTRFGPVTVAVDAGPGTLQVTVDGDWFDRPPRLAAALRPPRGSIVAVRQAGVEPVEDAGAGRVLP